MKPGWKTTEFWSTKITSLAVFAAAAAGCVPGKYAALAVALSEAAYAVARGLAKMGAAQ